MAGSMFQMGFGGSFGGFISGPSGGQTGQQAAQFGGGFMMNPMGQGQVVQEVQVQQGAVTYALNPAAARSRDRSGRKY